MITATADKPLFSFRFRPWQWLLTIAVVLLYTPLARVAGFYITVGLLALIPILIQAVRSFRFHMTSFAIIAGLLLLPIANFAVCMALEVEMLPSVKEFINSYALWTASLIIIYLGFNSTTAVNFQAAFKVNCFLVGLAVFQTILGRYFGNSFGFELVQPIVHTDVLEGYINVVDNPRGIATYYEPSMAGRIIATLAFMDMLQSRKILRNAVLALIGLWATSSFGMLIMVLAMGLVLVGRSVREFVIGFTLIIGALVVQQTFFANRTSGGSLQEGSTYRRVIAPRLVVSHVLYNYPAGVPVGSGEIVALKTGYVADTGESKVTNGVYEFIIYFGYVGIGVVLFSLIALSRFSLSDNRELALSMMYLLVSTAVSGSFFSLELSLLIFLFTIACRYAYIRRKRGELPEFSLR